MYRFEPVRSALGGHASRHSRGRLAQLTLIATLTLSATVILPASAAQSITDAPSPYHFKPGSCCYAGYTGNMSLGSTITKMTARWNIPAVTCQPGLSGPQQLITLIQVNVLMVGVRELCQEGSGTPSITAFAYFPLADSNFIVLPLKGLTVGDEVLATISINPNTNEVLGKLVNLNVTHSEGTHMEFVPIAAATAQGFIIGISSGSLLSFPFPMMFLAQFAPSVKFDNCATVDQTGTRIWLGGTPILTRFWMLDGSSRVMASPSTLTTHGKDFEITFVRST
jgi:hypothetical protein